jgi:hypothetical protein
VREIERHSEFMQSWEPEFRMAFERKGVKRAGVVNMKKVRGRTVHVCSW